MSQIPRDVTPEASLAVLADNHRCAGESITIAIMKDAVAMLTRAMDYVIPAQDLRIDRRRIPAVPASGFAITRVRARR